MEASRGTEILDFSGSRRYDFWEAAVDANATDPSVGIGPGTFDFWWTQHGSYAAYVRDAHSLYVETLAELGIIGLLLIGAPLRGRPRDRRVAGAQGATRPAGGDRRRNRRRRGLRRGRAR